MSGFRVGGLARYVRKIPEPLVINPGEPVPSLPLGVVVRVTKLELRARKGDRLCWPSRTTLVIELPIDINIVVNYKGENYGGHTDYFEPIVDDGLQASELTLGNILDKCRSGKVNEIS